MTSAASTASAAVPAPGKLEFKDDYTSEEAERVIRNSKGLPVGVKPKMVWTWPKALLWAAIAIVCAIGWAILACFPWRADQRHLVRGCGVVLLRDRLPFLRVLYSDQDHAYRRCERDAGRACA